MYKTCRNRYRSAILMMLTAIALSLFIVPAQKVAADGGNGYHVNLNRSSRSDVLIIGDSRVVGLAEDIKSAKVSFNATVGAHYIYDDAWVSGRWESRNMVIASSKYLAQQKAIVKDILKKHDVCKVVIVATVNDVGFWQWQKESLNRMNQLASRLKKVNKSRVKIYVVGMIPEAGYDRTVAGFNASLKKKYGSMYIPVGTTTSAWRNYYSGDKIHLTAKGSKRLYNKIAAALKKKG